MTLLAAVVTGSVAAVFLFSGAVKLASPRVTADAMVGFRVVRTSRLWLARALGTAEVGLGLGLALVLVPGPVLLGAAAAVLAVFGLVQAAALARGRAFPCGCFGEDADISVLGTVRTIGFAVAAAALATANGATADPEAVLTVALAVTAWLLAAKAGSAISRNELYA
jgi:hypothetical protein